MSDMENSPLRCAVVGVGYLGRFHAQKYLALESAELVGVCDADANRADSVAKELGVQAWTRLDQLVGQVDAVTVAASTPAHYEVVKFLLERDIHVNVEKPITSHSSDAEDLVQLARQRDLRLQVGHVERFNPAFQAARSKLKKPIFIECHRLAPFKPRSTEVDVVLDLMIHDLDVILTLVDSPVKSLAAVGTPVLTKQVDIANARIEFESGATANVTASRVSLNTTRKFRVFQADQYLSMDFGSGEVNLMTKTGEWSEGEELPITAESWSLEKSDALLLETQSFVDAVKQHRDCEVSGENGLVALRLAERILADIELSLQK